MKQALIKSTHILALILIVFFLSSATSDEKTAKVDKLFAKWDSTISPGAALAIVKDGRIIYERGYGMANLEYNIAITPTSVFRIGSTSKQFTAACIAILAIEGKISLDDDIRKYVPELFQYEKPVTIRHLIHHTSGINDYCTLEFDISFKSYDDFFTPEDTIKQIARQKKPSFSPGEEYSYSNSGYFLMGVIVERVTGKSLDDFAQENIFKPLGMKNTHFHDDHTIIVKNRADGYSPTEDGFRINMTTLDHVGDGSVFTTVEDLFLWDQAFYNYKVRKELMELLHTQGVLNNGKKIDYAFGLHVENYKGLRRVSHSGSFAGFRAAMIRFPEHSFSVICLANLGTISPFRLCLKIADIFLADDLKVKEKPKKKVKAVKLKKEELEEKTGNYQDEKSGMWVTISTKDGKLILEAWDEKFLLFPVSKTLFIGTDNSSKVSIDFSPKIEGEARKAKSTLYGEEINLVKAPKVIPLTPEQLSEYAGEYYSDEVPVTYKLLIKNGNLILKVPTGRNVPKKPLRLMAADNFILTGEWVTLNIVFNRDEKKKIMGLTVKVDRALIDFIKK